MKLNHINRPAISRRRNLTDLPDAVVVDESKGSAAPVAAGKKGKGKATKEVPAKKGKGKPAPAAKKVKDKVPVAKKAKKEKTAAEPRKPRVEGRVDLVFRSGPERAIATKLGEDVKAGEPIKVDNCTVGFNLKGEKGETLRATYLAHRDEYRKRVDALLQKFLSGEIKVGK